MNKEISIIIPVYKVTPDSFELISLKQCLKILNRYAITFVASESLNTSYYETLADQQIVKCKTEKFDDCFFSSIKGYNKLMLSQTFYSRFIQYQYILIYQLDCFVFRDELEYWCGLGYDYIGAPWIKLTKNNTPYLWAVGNGGLSLRKPARLLQSLEMKKIRMNFKGCFMFYKLLQKGYGIVNYILWVARIAAMCFGYRNNKSYFISSSEMNEDIIFSFVLHYTKNPLKIPDYKIALKFSFDREPELLYELNNFKLPFGCHDWYKYKGHLDFYRPFLISIGVSSTLLESQLESSI